MRPLVYLPRSLCNCNSLFVRGTLQDRSGHVSRGTCVSGQEPNNTDTIGRTSYGHRSIPLLNPSFPVPLSLSSRHPFTAFHSPVQQPANRLVRRAHLIFRDVGETAHRTIVPWGHGTDASALARIVGRTHRVSLRCPARATTAGMYHVHHQRGNRDCGNLYASWMATDRNAQVDMLPSVARKTHLRRIKAEHVCRLGCLRSYLLCYEYAVSRGYINLQTYTLTKRGY